MTCRQYKPGSRSVDAGGMIRSTHPAAAAGPSAIGFPSAATAGKGERLLAVASEGAAESLFREEEVRQP